MESVGMVFVYLAYVLASVVGIVLIALTIRYLWIVPRTLMEILDVMNSRSKEKKEPSKGDNILFDPDARKKADKEYAEILDDCTTLQ